MSAKQIWLVNPKLTDEEFDLAWERRDGFETPLDQGLRVAEAATQKVLRVATKKFQEQAESHEELLAALRLAEDALAVAESYTHSDQPRIIKAHEAVRAAIAKARPQAL